MLIEKMNIGNFFISYIIAMILTGCTLVIGLQNPIHSIIILMGVFIGGTFLLMILNLPYFGLLFMIVYVGAIVVLFLFIVMMLDIKMINVTGRFRDLFSYRHIIIPVFTIEALLLFASVTADSIWIYLKHADALIKVMEEANRYADFSIIFQETDPLRAIGIVIYTEAKTGLILAAILLFLSMVASILLTMEHFKVRKIKEQDPNIQALRNPNYTLRYLR